MKTRPKNAAYMDIFVSPTIQTTSDIIAGFGSLSSNNSNVESRVETAEQTKTETCTQKSAVTVSVNDIHHTNLGFLLQAYYNFASVLYHSAIAPTQPGAKFVSDETLLSTSKLTKKLMRSPKVKKQKNKTTTTTTTTKEKAQQQTNPLVKNH